MRKFEEADRKKKVSRIQVPPNPAGLSAEAVGRLQAAVKASLKNGYLPCGTAFNIARDAGVPRIAVGETADSMGIRITNCQIGCFKVDKITERKPASGEPDSDIMAALEAMKEKDELTCARVFEEAGRLKVPPMAVADVANRYGYKIKSCQLGCF